MSSSEADGNTIEQNDLGGGRFLVLLRPYVRHLVMTISLLSLLAVTNMALPFTIKLLIDDVFGGKDSGPPGAGANWTLLFCILGALIVIYATRNFLFFKSRMQALRVSEDLCFTLRKRLFEHLQQLSMRFYHSNQPGRIGARVMDDTFKIQTFIQDKLPTFLLNLLMFQVLVVILCVVNLPLALASMVVLPLQFLTYRHFKMSIKRSHSEAQENLASAYANLIEKFLGMEVVKGFSAESRETATFNRAIDASRQSQIRSQRYHFSQKVIADLLVGLGTIMLFGYGAYEVIRGRMTSGDFIMFFGYVGMLYPAVLELISGAGHLSKATASIDRVFEMLDVPAQDEGVIEDEPDRFQIRLGEVELRDVSFAFENSSMILSHVTLHIRPGERIAITGPSGSGKSTMLNLLPRFHRATSGDVLIDDANVNHVPVRSLRAGIAIAFQEVFLFNTSIIENLRYANPEATLDDIRRVCAITGADEVVDRLPNGFSTRVGEYGGELSRGEKQRITLARALLKNTPILILDEATASIDSASAKAIIERIFDELGDRTIIMVTHDANLLALADRAVSIQEGRVVYDGSPVGLLPNADVPGAMMPVPQESAKSADSAESDEIREAQPISPPKSKVRVAPNRPSEVLPASRDDDDDENVRDNGNGVDGRAIEVWDEVTRLAGQSAED